MKPRARRHFQANHFNTFNSKRIKWKKKKFNDIVVRKMTKTHICSVCLLLYVSGQKSILCLFNKNERELLKPRFGVQPGLCVCLWVNKNWSNADFEILDMQKSRWDLFYFLSLSRSVTGSSRPSAHSHVNGPRVLRHQSLLAAVLVGAKIHEFYLSAVIVP